MMISLLIASVLQAASVTPSRPYEIVLAGRSHDLAKPIAALDSSDGWRVTADRGSATLTSSVERALFGKGVCRFTYRADTTNAVFRIEPEKPITVASNADTVTLWIYGNNINGRAGYASGRKIPQLRLFAEFALGSEIVRVDLWKVRHPEWFLMMGVAQPEARRLIATGARLTALVFEGGPSCQDEHLDLTSLCVFKDPQKPLEGFKRMQLPFPTSERGIVPAEGRETLEFRYPAQPAESWDDLAFRLPGGEWIPLAIGGGIYPASARKNAKVVFSRYGDSIIADIEIPDGTAEEVRFGGARLPKAFERIPIPYYTYCERNERENRPWLISTSLDGKPLFLLASMDWNRAAASEPLFATPNPTLAVSNGGAEYKRKTDGRRNAVRERFVWSVSRDPQKTLPEIPNPSSPYRAVVGSHARAVLFSASKGSHDRNLEYLRSWKRRGLDKIILTDHEVMWRDGWESFTFRSMAAPRKGGDEGQRRYSRAVIDELGYRYGPYNAYTSISPVNRWWSLDAIAREQDGNPVQGGFRSHAPKPCFSAKMNYIIPQEIQRKFGFNCAYCDVITCNAPWQREDYDARNPGGAMYAAAIRDFAEVLLMQRQVWQGPVCSEGGIHYLYAGIVDSNYAQDSQYGLSARPWLVDFDLLKIHPLETDCGAGLTDQFYCWWRTVNDTDPEATREWRQSRWLAATLAFGHSALISHSERSAIMRDYFAVLAIASRYSIAQATEIRYGAADGTLLDTAAAIATGDYRRSQVRVRYSDGTIVAANGSRTNDFTVTVDDERRTLPPNGWFAQSADGKTASFSGLLDGQHVEYAHGDDYIYVNGRGRKISTPFGGTDGILVRIPSGPGKEEVIVEGCSLVELPFAIRSAHALGERREDLGSASFQVRNGRTVLRPAPTAISYLIEK